MSSFINDAISSLSPPYSLFVRHHFFPLDLKEKEGGGYLLKDSAKFLKGDWTYPRFRSKQEILDGANAPLSVVGLAAVPAATASTTTPMQRTAGATPTSSSSSRPRRTSTSATAESRRNKPIESLTEAEAKQRLRELQPDIARLEEEVANAKGLLAAAEEARSKGAPPLSFERMTTDPNIVKLLKSYTGFASVRTLTAFFDLMDWDGACDDVQLYRGLPDLEEGAKRRTARRGQAGRALMPKDAYVLTLFMLRTGCTERSAAGLFGVSTDTVSRYFVSWLVFMSTFFEAFFPYPTAEQLNQTTNQRLREALLAGDTAGKLHFEAFIDCHEEEIERPRDKTVARAVWSEYKQRTTAKFLGAISGCGAFTFTSNAYPGRITDPSITKLSGFLDKIHKEGLTSADKGFMMHSAFADKMHYLAVPAKARRGQQFYDTDQMMDTATIARKRIHVERAFRRAQEYEILHRRIPITQADIWGMVFSVSCFLCNFQPPLMDDREHGHGDSAATRATTSKKSEEKKVKKKRRSRKQQQRKRRGSRGAAQLAVLWLNWRGLLGGGGA